MEGNLLLEGQELLVVFTYQMRHLREAQTDDRALSAGVSHLNLASEGCTL